MESRFRSGLLTGYDAFHTFLKKQEELAIPHYHADYEMNFVLEGLGTRYVGNHVEAFEEGDLILIAPNIPHCWQHSGRHKPYASFVIQWKSDFLGNGWENITEFKDIGRLLSLAKQGVKFDKYIGKEIRQIQPRLLQLPPFEKLILLLQLLNEMSRANEYETLSEESLSLKTPVNYTRIAKVYHFIKEKYTQKITLSQIAAHMNMSEGAFSRLFSQTTGKPFFSFLNEYRVMMACKMLVETDKNTAEIGYQCGYDCLQFYYRQFSKYVGCTPKEFRKRLEYK